MTHVLTLNGGSSSIRFAVYDAGNYEAKVLDGKIERIGAGGTRLSVAANEGGKPSREEFEVDAADHRRAAESVVRHLADHGVLQSVVGAGHRVVHGLEHSQPERLTPDLRAELTRIIPYAPEHLPEEIELIDALGRARPDLPQVACFDTAFHRSMPRVATLLPIPRRYQSKGVRRYGFHGLSYTYLMSALVRVAGAAAAGGRVILAHLGNGASLAAVRGGLCVDTSMGFTPAAGLVMGTRSGDLDPGLMSFLARTEAMDAAGYQCLVTHESGLLGVSEISADIRELLAREPHDARAAEAVALFCQQAKKWIGSFAAVLGGVDTLVFAGGIGENAAPIRARICAGLQFLGIELDETRNAHSAALISADAGRVAVRVIPTDEESVIASSTARVLNIAA